VGIIGLLCRGLGGPCLAVHKNCSRTGKHGKAVRLSSEGGEERTARYEANLSTEEVQGSSPKMSDLIRASRVEVSAPTLLPCQTSGRPPSGGGVAAPLWCLPWTR
jgi:hypothetical protein